MSLGRLDFVVGAWFDSGEGNLLLIKTLRSFVLVTEGILNSGDAVGTSRLLFLDAALFGVAFSSIWHCVCTSKMLSFM